MRSFMLSRLHIAVLLIVSAVIFCSSLFFFVTRKKPIYPQDFSQESVDATKLAEGIFLLRGAGGNVTVAVSEEQVIIVDTDFAEMASRIDAAILEIARRPVDIVINTHSHTAHRGANAYFAGRGAEVIAQKIARDAIRNDKFSKASERDIPTRVLTDRLLLSDGVELIHIAGGHTSGDVVVYFSEANVLVAGDLFIKDGFPSINEGDGGGIDGYLKAQEKLLSMADGETIIVPGHGGPARIGDLQESYEMLFEVRNRVAKLKRQGMSETEMVHANPMQNFRARWNYAGIRANQFARNVYRTLPKNPKLLPEAPVGDQD